MNIPQAILNTSVTNIQIDLDKHMNGTIQEFADLVNANESDRAECIGELGYIHESLAHKFYTYDLKQLLKRRFGYTVDERPLDSSEVGEEVPF